MQMQTFLHASVPRIDCPHHHVKAIKLPWANPRSKFTLLFEKLAIDLLKECSISKVCELLRVSWDEADGIMYRAVRRGLSRKEQRSLKRIAIDETSYAKGQSYLTLVNDGNGAVEFVSEGRRMDSLSPYFKGLSPLQLTSFEAISMDMWEPYIKCTKQYVPEAHKKIVFDKYHVMYYLNQAVDRTRREEHRQLRKDNIQTLNKTKYLWLYNPDNLPDKHRPVFEDLKKQNLKVGRAWAIKESFREFWTCPDEQSAREFFESWYNWASRSQLRHVIKTAKMILTRIDNIVTYCSKPITNANAEALNAKVQHVKRTARGFRNIERFKTAIYFHCGKLDLYPL
jgi:transposase